MLIDADRVSLNSQNHDTECCWLWFPRPFFDIVFMDLDKKHYAWCKSEQELISYNKLQTETLYGKWWIGIKNDCMLQVKKWKPNENKVLTTAAVELLDHNSSIYVFWSKRNYS